MQEGGWCLLRLLLLPGHCATSKPGNFLLAPPTPGLPLLKHCWLFPAGLVRGTSQLQDLLPLLHARQQQCMEEEQQQQQSCGSTFSSLLLLDVIVESETCRPSEVSTWFFSILV